MALNGQKPLYFSSNFRDPTKKIKHQVERMYDFCGITGRRGVLAVELYKQPESRNAFLIPFQEIFVLWKRGRPGVSLKTIRDGTPLEWKGAYSTGHYSF